MICGGNVIDEQAVVVPRQPHPLLVLQAKLSQLCSVFPPNNLWVIIAGSLDATLQFQQLLPDWSSDISWASDYLRPHIHLHGIHDPSQPASQSAFIFKS